MRPHRREANHGSSEHGAVPHTCWKRVHRPLSRASGNQTAHPSSPIQSANTSETAALASRVTRFCRPWWGGVGEVGDRELLHIPETSADAGELPDVTPPSQPAPMSEVIKNLD